MNRSSVAIILIAVLLVSSSSFAKKAEGMEYSVGLFQLHAEGENGPERLRKSGPFLNLQGETVDSNRLAMIVEAANRARDARRQRDKQIMQDDIPLDLFEQRGVMSFWKRELLWDAVGVSDYSNEYRGSFALSDLRNPNHPASEIPVRKLLGIVLFKHGHNRGTENFSPPTTSTPRVPPVLVDILVDQNLSPAAQEQVVRDALRVFLYGRAKDDSVVTVKARYVEGMEHFPGWRVMSQIASFEKGAVVKDGPESLIYSKIPVRKMQGTIPVYGSCAEVLGPGFAPYSDS